MEYIPLYFLAIIVIAIVYVVYKTARKEAENEITAVQYQSIANWANDYPEVAAAAEYHLNRNSGKINGGEYQEIVELVHRSAQIKLDKTNEESKKLSVLIIQQRAKEKREKA